MEMQMSNGLKIPTIALGTLQCSTEDIKVAVRAAIDAGYRHIDTATAYMNEAAIGEVLKECVKEGKINREDLFITTKLLPCDLDYSDVRPALMGSLERLQLEYVDLYLIHDPFGCQRNGDYPLTRDESGKVIFRHDDITQTWKAMEELVDEGKIRSIGLSNCNVEQVERIHKSARIKPVVNQVECHPYLPQFVLQEACNKLGVLMAAYAPLGTAGSITSGTHKHLDHGVTLTEHAPNGLLLEDPTITDIAKSHGKTAAQVLIKYLVQRKMVVIPKSANPKRIQENFAVFDWQLNESDMTKISNIKTRFRYFNFKSIFVGHPEYTWKNEGNFSGE